MNPYQSRRLARRLHVDRERRIEKLLVRLAANGDLHPAENKVLNPHYVWCDKHGEIHDNTLNPYGYVEDGKQDYCTPEQHRAVFVQSTDPNEDF